MDAIPDFLSAAASFAKFAKQQGYPETLLWITSERLLFWRHRYFVLSRDLLGGRREVSAAFDAAIARQTGIAMESCCRTDRVTVCRLRVPTDVVDSELRMLPETGVKMSVATEQWPTTLVKSRLRWWALQRLSRGSRGAWD